jgi:hypothetical protein
MATRKLKIWGTMLHKMDLKDIYWKDVKWIELVQDGV